MLVIENVHKTYGRPPAPVTNALKQINLTISEGEFTVLAGPSGSGKTTLLNIMGLLDQPDEGEVYLKGEKTSELSKNDAADLRLHNIGFVFQSYNLIEVLTAVENVEYVMLLQGVGSRTRRHKAKEILCAVGLEECINRKPTEMSGGQQQRVAVARAIVAEPSLVLADEPTANLDSKTGHQLIELMKHFNESKGVTFCISSHDPMVIDMARRLIRVKDGIADEV